MDAEVDPALYTVRRQLHERLVLHARIIGVSPYTNEGIMNIETKCTVIIILLGFFIWTAKNVQKGVRLSKMYTISKKAS